MELLGEIDRHKWNDHCATPVHEHHNA
jgi:hypothetical protein